MSSACLDEMRTLVFDLDDTLVVEEQSAEAAFRATCALAHKRAEVNPETLHKSIRQCCRELWHQSPARSYCIDVGISSWEGLWAEFHGDSESLRTLSEWKQTYRQQSWLGALQRCGVPRNDALATELAETFVRERRRRHVVYPDVLPTLQSLKQRYRLGLLTNGAPDLQKAKLENSGLAPMFDATLISGDIGIGKPNVRVFELILDQLGGRTATSVMIGNSLKSDVLPAMRMGMKGIWLNRERTVRDDSIAPHIEVNSLVELRALLET
ncbi:MAG: HAD family hydrolase [Candidatus Hydrogenedentes bacterium]|nr:HAD family hydrolase [Candidatus Hydrogenedentota bacterium]